MTERQAGGAVAPSAPSAAWVRHLFIYLFTDLVFPFSSRGTQTDILTFRPEQVSAWSYKKDRKQREGRALLQGEAD